MLKSPLEMATKAGRVEADRSACPSTRPPREAVDQRGAQERIVRQFNRPDGLPVAQRHDTRGARLERLDLMADDDHRAPGLHERIGPADDVIAQFPMDRGILAPNAYGALIRTYFEIEAFREDRPPGGTTQLLRRRPSPARLAQACPTAWRRRTAGELRGSAFPPPDPAPASRRRARACRQAGCRRSGETCRGRRPAA